MPRSLAVTDQIRIPGQEFSLTFVRSSGPGGQNVNKVNSKAVLRWNVKQSDSLPQEVKARFLDRFASRLSQEGELVIASDRHRQQPRNVADVYERLRLLLLAVASPPRRRRKTRPSRAAVERRLRDKRQRSERKAQRRQRPE